MWSSSKAIVLKDFLNNIKTTLKKFRKQLFLIPKKWSKITHSKSKIDKVLMGNLKFGDHLLTFIAKTAAIGRPLSPKKILKNFFNKSEKTLKKSIKRLLTLKMRDHTPPS